METVIGFTAIAVALLIGLGALGVGVGMGLLHRDQGVLRKTVHPTRFFTANQFIGVKILDLARKLGDQVRRVEPGNQ